MAKRTLLLFFVFVLAGCAQVNPTIEPTQKVQLPSPTKLPETNTVAPTSTQAPTVTETPSPTTTQTPRATLGPENVKETMQPLLQDPLNCAIPCFMGITPGKTSLDDAKAFFGPLGLIHREGIDPYSGTEFYSVGYDANIGRTSGVIFTILNNLVNSIEITPEIIEQKEGSPREWIAYSPEILIKKFGKPSRVVFWIDGGPQFTTIMIMYFDESNLIVYYSGVDKFSPGNLFSPRLCPLTAPFDYVRLWIGENPPHPPMFDTVPLEKATSLTLEQFTQLMLGTPQNACFTINDNAFH